LKFQGANSVGQREKKSITMKLLIKNGHVVDPANKIDDILDILIDANKISLVGKDIKASVDKTIDATKRIVMPGIIDMHVHLREPGREDKETIASGTLAALKGGITSVLAMPNTQIPIDCSQNLKLLKSIIKKTSHANVLIAAAITKARQGKELTEISQLKKEGILAITDDGASVDDERLMSEALKQAMKHKVLVICHCEDVSISKDGVINLGFISTRLGLRGVSCESEYRRVRRDIQLAEKLGASIHIAHVSCKESVEIIAKAKKKSLRLSAETAPHYFSFSEEDLLGYNTNMKVNPPLRSKEDVVEIKQGLKSGVIDVIASDHAPHTDNEKIIEFERAEFGAIGLETELAASITELVDQGILNWTQLVQKFTVNPAKILGIDRGTLGKGAIADIIIVDTEREWTVESKDFLSRSKNSPFIGRRLKGIVELTILNGKIAYNRC